jgi:protein gp37
MARRFKKEQKKLYIDRVEAEGDLGRYNKIFVCSGCDLFHPDVPDWWIEFIGQRTFDYSMNTYILHTKNPGRAVKFYSDFTIGTVLCATIETDADIPGISKAPLPIERFEGLGKWPQHRMITIEPVMDFDLENFSQRIIGAEPDQVNIGADSGYNHLPEPPPEKIRELVEALRPYTRVHLKKNLSRIYKE